MKTIVMTTLLGLSTLLHAGTDAEEIDGYDIFKREK